MSDQTHRLQMKNGVNFEVHFCLDPKMHFTRDQLKAQIRKAMACLSPTSRWQRFASPVAELSGPQLDYLTNLDGVDRVAWCAIRPTGEDFEGIGLARYSRLEEETETAEFAVTVVDQYQGQGVGRALLRVLMDSAKHNGILLLRGYVTPGNKRMLGLARKMNAHLHQGTDCMTVELATDSGR